MNQDDVNNFVINDKNNEDSFKQSNRATVSIDTPTKRFASNPRSKLYPKMSVLSVVGNSTFTNSKGLLN